MVKLNGTSKIWRNRAIISKLRYWKKKSTDDLNMKTNTKMELSSQRAYQKENVCDVI